MIERGIIDLVRNYLICINRNRQLCHVALQKPLVFLISSLLVVTSVKSSYFL